MVDVPADPPDDFWGSSTDLIQKSRCAGKAFAVAQGHAMGQWSRDGRVCVCHDCGAALVDDDAVMVVLWGDVRFLGQVARRCLGVNIDGVT